MSTAEESTGVEDRGYIRPAAVEEPPFCVRPVTGSIFSALPWDVYLVCGSRTCLLDTCQERYWVISVSPVFCFGGT